MSDISIVKTKEDVGLQIAAGDGPGGPDPAGGDQGRPILQSTRTAARISGQGKAPEAVVRRRFGEAIRQTVLEELIRESWDAAHKAQESQADRRAAHPQPQVRGRDSRSSSSSTSRSGPMCALKSAAGFTVQREVKPVTSTRTWRRSSATCRSGRPPGCRSKGRSRPRARWYGWRWRRSRARRPGSSQPYTMVLGEGRAIPDVEERVMTLLPGETVDAEVRFPDDHPDESKRGQTRGRCGSPCTK